MNRITIGLAGDGWAPATTARYYAERDGGDDYAFGSSPVEALTKLEARQNDVAQNFDRDLADEIAFLALGAAEYIRGQSGIDFGKHGGYMGLIGEVIRHAPMLAAYWKRMAPTDFGGVWLYDVTERFGREWAEEVLHPSHDSPSQRLECIIEDELEKWR